MAPFLTATDTVSVPLKMIKRQMYGRAGLRLLMARVVNAARLASSTLVQEVAPVLDHRKRGRTRKSCAVTCLELPEKWVSGTVGIRFRVESHGQHSPSEVPIAMEPVIRKLIIQGFRSFRCEVVDFDNPTFLVGRNGSGKSNLIDAIAFLKQAMTSPLSDLISWRGGGRVVYHGSSTLPTNGEYRTFGLGVVLGAISDEIATARYAFQVAATGTRRPSYVVRREQCIVDRRDGRRD